jgi:hypothetical protein
MMRNGRFGALDEISQLCPDRPAAPHHRSEGRLVIRPSDSVFHKQEITQDS